MRSTGPISPSAPLAAILVHVPDPRRHAGVVYPLPAILALAVTAILCAHTSVLAIAEWGARQSTDRLFRLGFPDGRVPCQTTLHRRFRQLDAQTLAAALHVAFEDPTEREHGVAVDGKAQHGRQATAPDDRVVHMLTAFAHEHSVILAEEPIEQGRTKAEAELTVVPRLLAHLDWRVRVLTGDALYCQRTVCQHVLAAGGDYLLAVKGNQPTLLRGLRRLFDPEARPLLACQKA